MNQQIREVLFASDTRYPTEAEQAVLRGYGEGILARIDVAAAIERAEPAILDTAMQSIRKTYPRLAELYGLHVDKTIRRDLAYVLRYATHGMLTLDPDMVRDKLAIWMRTILFSMNDASRVVYGYQELRAAAETHLTESDFGLLAPYIDIVLRELKSEKGRAA